MLRGLSDTRYSLYFYPLCTLPHVYYYSPQPTVFLLPGAFPRTDSVRRLSFAGSNRPHCKKDPQAPPDELQTISA